MESDDKLPQEPGFTEFETWRKFELDIATRNCLKHEEGKLIETTYSLDYIKKAPKCLVHLTRRACKCNQDCIGISFLKSPINSTCKTFDTTLIWYDDKYRDCKFLDYTLKDGNLTAIEEIDHDKELSDKISEGIEKLCLSSDGYLGLIYDAYELRDKCENKLECIEKFLYIIPTDTCENESFKEQRAYVEAILNYKFGLANSNQSGLTELVEKVKKVNKREVSSYDNFDSAYFNNDLEYNSLEGLTSGANSSIQTFSSSAITLSVTSTLLLFILAFFGLRDSKNGKIVLPAIILTTAMTIISLNLTLNN